MARGAGGFRVDMKLYGAKRTRAQLTIKEAGVKRASHQGVLEWARLAVEVMKSIVPIRTGALRDAIKVDSIERLAVGGWQAFVGPGNRIRYAAFVEYGTHDTPEQPYARPTTAIAHQIGPDEITRAVRKAL